MTVHANGRMLGTGTEINAKWKVDEERARGGKSDFTSDRSLPVARGAPPRRGSP